MNLEPATLAQNGHALPSVPTDEWHRIDQAYQELQRRDESAEYRAWRAERRLWGMMALFVLTLGVVVWQSLHAHTVQAFVQVVQVDEKGHLVQVGIPQDLLAYTPDEGVWRDMLTEWVVKLRWRPDDTAGKDGTPGKPVVQRDWAWVYRHTCGQARRLLQEREDREKPFAPSTLLRAVEIKSIQKIPVPESYHVEWVETSTDKTQPAVKTATWSGSFTVGRYRPPTLAETLGNSLGLCVTAFTLDPQL
jgi:type IV secretory pathway TrbF-like protein